MNLKTIFMLILALCVLPVAYSDSKNTTVEDLELQTFLDSALPNFQEEVVVIGRFFLGFDLNHEGTGQTVFRNMLETLFTGNFFGEQVFNPNASLERRLGDKVDELDQTAQSIFRGLSGGYLPSENWAVVINVNRKNIKGTFAATNFAGDGEGNFSASSSNNQALPFAEMTGNQLNVNGENFVVAGAVNFSPIMLDLDLSGQPDTNRNQWTPHAPAFYGERTAVFDMSGDGNDDFIEWVGTKDALLVMPETDGSVKNANNLFGTAGGYKDGYQKMSIVLDADKNGFVEGDELNGLYLWHDLNGNARADKGEMRTVQEVGVERINVAHKNYQSTCVVKGKEVKTWDWWPSCYELMKVKKNQ